MKTYRHLPTEVSAVQVEKPYREFKHHFPRHHEVKLPSGRISYFHVVDAPPTRSKAFPGDWVLKLPDGSAQILSDAEFSRIYEDPDAGDD
jgi:hypothetical protein